MPGLDSLIFSLALDLFLLIGSIKLIIEGLIIVVTQFKKLKATVESEYSLEKGKLEIRSRGQPDASENVTHPVQSSADPHTQQRQEDNSPL